MVDKVDKLVPNLRNKEKYVIKLYDSLGLKITKIRIRTKFKESA